MKKISLTLDKNPLLLGMHGTKMLKGKDGDDGKSAYEIWLEQGNEGTEAEFLESLKGDDYVLAEADKEVIANMAAEKVQKPNIPEGMASEDWVNENFQPKGSYATTVQLAQTEAKIPTKVSELGNDKNYLDAETDPTVPPWAKNPEKPTYTKGEIGLGNVDNVRQYSANNPPPYPVTGVNGKTGNVNLSASDVGADAAGTAETSVTNHNAAEDSHNDIRLLIAGLTARFNAFMDSDDDTLDQASELVEYIKANRALIESVTTTKVNVSDIIDNLTTSVSNKPLSAKQGVALKALIDAIKVPTKLSELSADATHRTVTDAEKTTWNNKSDFSGDYNDLSNKPTNISAFNNDAGYMKNSEQQTVIDAALAQAKASGEFDGEDGFSIYKAKNEGNETPEADIDYNYEDIEDEGRIAKNGDFILSPAGYLYKITSSSSGVFLCTFCMNLKGADGTSVTVKSVSESTEPGGSNVVTFSDGKTLTTKNGPTGPAYTLNDTDKTTIVNAVIEALPVYSGEVI